MAKKRTKKRASPSAPRAAAKPRKHHRRRRSRGLSSAFTHAAITNAVKHTVSSGLGGYGATYVNKWIPPTWGKLPRVAAILTIGAAMAHFGMPHTGAGFTGGMTALTFQNGLLGEEESFADEDALSDMPLFLDDDGRPMVLEESDDGRAGYRYLSEEEIRVLDEQGAFTDYQVVS